LKAVRPYSFKGKFLAGIIVVFCSLLSVFMFKKWRNPRVFEENARTMNWKDLIYFAYKYYFKPPFSAKQTIIDHFKKNSVSPAEIIDADLTISIGGDLMPYDLINEKNCKNLWSEVGSAFFGSDIVFANLETPIDIDQKLGFVPEIMLNDMHFNGNEDLFNIFNGNGKFKGFDILSVANNHSLDMGDTGLLNTLSFLEKKNIKHTGAKKKAEDNGFEIIDKNGIKTAFLSYTYSFNQFEPSKQLPYLANILPLNVANCNIETMQNDTKKARLMGADLVICALHCGNAYQAYPNQNTIDLFQRIFETCGIDIIAGGHPHNLQPFRYYQFKDPFTQKNKTGFAIYSLADFVAYDIFTWCQLSAFLKIKVKRNANQETVFSVEVNPLIMERNNEQLVLKDASKVFSKTNLDKKDQSLKDLAREIGAI